MFFKGEYYFLSNMYPCPVIVTIGITRYTFTCAESAYQACKCPERANEFVGLDGYKAKKLGKQVKLRPDWEQIKLKTMETIVKAKFDQNIGMIPLLRNIQGNIIEDNTWNDKFWGVYNGIGENHLGNILMELRNYYNKFSKEDQKTLTVCFTGPRPKSLFGYNHDAYIPMVEALKKEIRALVVEGYTRFITGGAQGFDQLAFWAVNSLKQKDGYNIQNIVYIPFERQEAQWKETGLFSQAEYRLMLKLADEVKTLRVIDRNNIQEVTNALFNRNHVMVDDANLVFGLYMDYGWQISSTKSGTAECLRYAYQKDKFIYQMFTDTLCCEYIYPNSHTGI